MDKFDNLPLVSIIIPTFNRAHLISQSIKSVIEQTYPCLEIIIVDDGSNDNTEAVIKIIDDARIKYLKQEKLGASAARNRGIKEARGQYISFLDSDDTYTADKIEKQLNAIMNAPQKTGAVYCGINFIDGETRKIIGHKIHRVNFLNNFKYGTYFLTPTTGTVLLKREAIFSVGLFDESLPAHQDTELAIRFCQKYEYLLVDEYLVNAMKNHQQISSNAKNHTEAKEIIFEKYKNFLSKHILYGMCKHIAGYYINTGNFEKAKHYIIKALEIRPFRLLTLLQFCLISISPRSLKTIYEHKK